MLKQTAVYNVSSLLHAKYLKHHLKFDAVCAFSFVQGYNTFSLCYERLLSTRVSNVSRVSLSNVLRLVGAVFGPALFSAQFWTYEIRNFYFCSFFFMQRSSGHTFGDNWRLSGGHTFGDNWRLSGGHTFGDNWRLSGGPRFGDNVTFSVIQLSV